MLSETLNIRATIKSTNSNLRTSLDNLKKVIKNKDKDIHDFSKKNELLESKVKSLEEYKRNLIAEEKQNKKIEKKILKKQRSSIKIDIPTSSQTSNVEPIKIDASTNQNCCLNIFCTIYKKQCFKYQQTIH